MRHFSGHPAQRLAIRKHKLDHHQRARPGGLIAVDVKAGVETGAAAAISTRTTVAALVSARNAVVTVTAANA